MPHTARSSRPSCARALACALLLPSLLACESEEAKQMKRLAGTYAMTSNDTLAARFMGKVTLTLRQDGRWQSESEPDTVVFPRPAAVDSGTYRVRGPLVAIRSSEGFMTYVVRGDTLAWQPEERELRTAQTEAITGVKLVGQVETFYVRVSR